MKFTKMQGCGNDYVYVNGFTEKLSPEEKPEIVRSLSDRHFGIGGDGVIFINPAEEADFEMEMYNADGSRGEMCGNGIRCVGKYMYDYGLTDKEAISVETLAGIKYLQFFIENGKVAKVKVDMGSPILTPAEIPVVAEGERAVDDMPTVVRGNNHVVACTETADKLCRILKFCHIARLARRDRISEIAVQSRRIRIVCERVCG